MILLLLDALKNQFGFKIPTVFFYYSTRMMLAAASSLILVIFLGPLFIKIMDTLKREQAVRTEDVPLLHQLHMHKKSTPTMGGALIIFAMLVSMLFWMDITHIFTLILFLTTAILGILGACDDYLKLKHTTSKGISGKKKLFVQSFVAGMLALYLLYPPFTESLAINHWFTAPIVKEHVDIREKNVSTKPQIFASQPNQQHTQLSVQDYASRFYFPFVKGAVVKFSGLSLALAALIMMFVVVGSSNAVNLTDGLDGLASGCLIMVASCLAIFAFVSNNMEFAKYLNILYVEGSGEIAIYLSAFLGACIGFLWYNGHPAQLFMGDTGSLALGGVIGVCAVLLKREALLGLIGGIFVVETLSVILQVLSYKFRNKIRIFLCGTLHHHYECKGWPETKVVIRFWIIGLLLAILGIASLKFQ